MTQSLVLTLVLVFVASFAATILLTPIAKMVAWRFGWVDRPDQIRKTHSAPIPRIGGIAVITAYLASIGLLAVLRPQHIEDAGLAIDLVWRLLPAVAPVFLIGILDDRFILKPWQKLAGQVAAAGLACAVGVQIHAIGATALRPWAGVPLTLIWLVACSNAFNLIDGVDGLASGVGFFATVTVSVAGLLHGDFGLALAVAPLSGALAGFLRYNLNPATVFLGDAGSLTIGFLLGCYGVVWAHKSTTLLGMTAPLMALAVPLCDTAVAVLRRFVRSKPIFSADRAHIHHRLLDHGLTPRRVVFLLYAASGVAAIFALLQSWVSTQLNGFIFLLFCAVTWVGVHRLKYAEFSAVSRILRLQFLRSLLTEQLRLQTLEESLASAIAPEDYWRAIRDGAREFGFNSVEVALQGHLYSELLRDVHNGHWALRIPLTGSDYVCLTRGFESSDTVITIAPFIEFVHRKMGIAAGIRPLSQRPETGTTPLPPNGERVASAHQ